jgi:transcriptional regulator with XRE-family HTH domain
MIDINGNKKGFDLSACRKLAGLTLKALAQRAVISCSAVKYWERKAGINPNCRAVKSIAKALGIRDLTVFPQQYARAGGWGVTGWDQIWAQLDAEVELQMVAWRQRAALRAARLRVVCGAKTRKDTPCRNLSEPGKMRCKFHGGKSTGPRSVAGRANIAEAQRVRWAKWRAI